MADSNYGLREITLDLTSVGARVIRDALKNEWVKIQKIVVTGTSGAAAGNLILRKESATGPIVWALTDPTAATTYNIDAPFNSPAPVGNGLYMDAIGTAWAAGATMIIYTA